MAQIHPNISSEDIECRALDSSGHLGSLYDKREDCILTTNENTVAKGSTTVLKSSDCKVTNVSMSSNFNLLQFIGIDAELRLNLLLNLRRRIGVAAVLNYPRRIDERTRILYYSYTDRHEHMINITEVSKMLQLSDPRRQATHVITGITFGIDLTVIIQLTSTDDIITKMDEILEKICGYLRCDHNNPIMALKDEEISLFERNTTVAAYSNTPNFTALTRISEILHYIDRNKNAHSCQPINYYLRPTKQLHPQYIAVMMEISPTLIEDIEQSLLQCRTAIQYLKASFKDDKPKAFIGRLVNLFYDAERQWSGLNKKYEKVVDRLSHVVKRLRNGQENASTVYSILHDDAFSTLVTNIRQLIRDVCELTKQKPSITPSRQRPFTDHNPIERNSYESDSTSTIYTMSERDDRRGKSVYDDHALNKNDHSKRESSDQILADKDKNCSNLFPKPVPPLCPVVQLESIRRSSDDTSCNETQRRLGTPSPADVPQAIDPPRPFSPATCQIINILLLGETGVGKSTFINAFVNYLSFDTFEQAESNKPVVLIPVSFLMTVGDNFEERTVKFGDIDDSKNEDFDHPGQSVTQHCKSYIFHLKDRKKLCIIDTPGFGDTRGLDQDDHNMQHILEYINNISHLNAICFLLKPNTSRLNLFFRSCLTQLFDLLGPSISQNLTFCFTNARATFYTPGDTAPLLKSMLKSLPTQHIPFEKQNTFCFDSESFRYLVALRNNIPFDEENRKEYEMSWSTSVKESNRLTDYIRKKIVLHPNQGQWQSVRHAQFEIIYMIRPMLEAIRNILRNIILQKTGSSSQSTVLCPIVIHRPASLCLLCKQEKIWIDRFGIRQDCPHEIQNICLHCSCSPEHHIRTDYILRYQSMANSPKQLQNQEGNELIQLCESSAMFAYFLVCIAGSTNEDPFDAGLTQMIVQESELCDHHNSNDPNLQLSKELLKVQGKHEENMNRMKSNHEQIPLTRIYDLMATVRQLSTVEPQINAINQGREIIMKQHENEHQEI